jgi:competence protein ComEC
VGQGDATLVHLPDGTWMLVDGGGNFGDDELRVGKR